MPTTYLKLTADDLKAKVNPTDDPARFQFGDDPELMSEQAVVDMLELEENSVLSACPELYRDIAFGNVSGEYLTDKVLGAKGTETTLTLAFAPIVTGSLIVYKNYDSLSKPWESRKRSDAYTDYTVNETTGAITLNTALTAGDQVIVEYQHNAGEKLITLRDLVLKSARLELMEILGTWNDGTQALTDGREWIDNKLMSFQVGNQPRGVGEIDRVAFYIETRQNHRNAVKMPFMRGAL